MSKVGVSCASGENQIVVSDLQIDGFHFFGLDVHGFHFRKDDLYVAAFAQDGADWGGNIGG